MRRSGSDPVRGLTPTAVALLLTALVFAGDARALSCPQLPPDERIAGADVAFVGRVVAERPAARGQLVYRFAVDQVVKGPVGTEVEVHAVRLTDLDDRAIAHDVAVGVLASTGEGGRLVTGSCSIVDPASLLAATDEPRGTLIKVGIGILILGAVVGYSLLRLRRRSALRGQT